MDIKCCHRYLNSELLSAYTRKGDFGGSLENRTRLLRSGVAAAQAATGSDFIVTSRLNVYDGFAYPYGWGVREGEGTEVDLTEPLELVRVLHQEMGMKLLDVTIGNPYFNPHRAHACRLDGRLRDPRRGLSADLPPRCEGQEITGRNAA